MGYSLGDIKQTLQDTMALETLEVKDDSHKHIGHAGFKEGVITHIAIQAKGEAFEGLSRVNAHRKVNDALAPFFEQGLHAVSIKIMPLC